MPISLMPMARGATLSGWRARARTRTACSSPTSPISHSPSAVRGLPCRSSHASEVIVSACGRPNLTNVYVCSWMYGPNWPSHGEFDIFETYNMVGTNTMTLHTDSASNVGECAVTGMGQTGITAAAGGGGAGGGAPGRGAGRGGGGTGARQ